MNLSVCRIIDKNCTNAEPVQRCYRKNVNYIEDAIRIFMEYYRYDKFMYKAYVSNHPQEPNDESLGSWEYSFTVGLTTVTGYIEGVPEGIYPEWNMDRVYDADDGMEWRTEN